jgi:hypothetical protein
MARHTSRGGNVAPRRLEALIKQMSPVVSDLLWVVVGYLHRYITVSDGRLGGERAPIRRYVLPLLSDGHAVATPPIG